MSAMTAVGTALWASGCNRVVPACLTGRRWPRELESNSDFRRLVHGSPRVRRYNDLMNAKKITATLQAAVLAAAAGLAACATAPDGVFEPACIAYSGERIELDDGRFEWNRFTDAVAVDDDGNRIDPFPGFPKRGRYETDGNQIRWLADDGTTLSERYLVEHGNRMWLLSYEQNEAFLAGEPMPACALALAD